VDVLGENPRLLREGVGVLGEREKLRRGGDHVPGEGVWACAESLLAATEGLHACAEGATAAAEGVPARGASVHALAEGFGVRATAPRLDSESGRVLTTRPMSLHLLALAHGRMVGEFALSMGALTLGSGASAKLVVEPEVAPDALCQLELQRDGSLTVTALGEGDVRTGDGSSAFRGRLRAGDWADVGELRLVFVERDDARAATLSGIPYAPAPTLERAAVTRPDVGDPLALLLRFGGKSYTFPLALPEIVIGRFDRRKGQEKLREAGLLDVPHPAVSRKHLVLRRLGDQYVAFDTESTHGTFAGSTQVREITLGVGTRLRLGEDPDAPTLEVHRLRELENAPPEDDALAGFLGLDGGMAEVRSQLLRAARTTDTVLLLGPNGSGKGALFRALAKLCQPGRPPETLDCASIPEQLAESALFGHVRGAFTGASEDVRGAFLLAGDGLLFLDEIGELRPQLQAKLLRALDDRQVRRIGEEQPQPVRCRLVAATNRDLAAMVADGSFREDLFHRFDRITIRIPPLSKRLQDIPALAEKFLRERGPEAPRLSEGALAELLTYPWPGNVRQLHNVLARCAIFCDGPVIERELAARMLGPTGPAAVAPPVLRDLPAHLESIERAYLVRALSEQPRNHAEAARSIGLERGRFLRRIQHYGLARAP